MSVFFARECVLTLFEASGVIVLYVFQFRSEVDVCVTFVFQGVMVLVVMVAMKITNCQNTLLAHNHRESVY